ncbi:MAG: hypothetical protein M1828_001293 [Chrysothrix sp. TS-e1954]|nr:MAG: hypothetical protein M1828_001293 [Chrysothrix sp. TS-e1954]
MDYSFNKRAKNEVLVQDYKQAQNNLEPPYAFDGLASPSPGQHMANYNVTPVSVKTEEQFSQISSGSSQSESTRSRSDPTTPTNSGSFQDHWYDIAPYSDWSGRANQDLRMISTPLRPSELKFDQWQNQYNPYSTLQRWSNELLPRTPSEKAGSSPLTNFLHSNPLTSGGYPISPARSMNSDVNYYGNSLDPPFSSRNEIFSSDVGSFELLPQPELISPTDYSDVATISPADTSIRQEIHGMPVVCASAFGQEHAAEQPYVSETDYVDGPGGWTPNQPERYSGNTPSPHRRAFDDKAHRGKFSGRRKRERKIKQETSDIQYMLSGQLTTVPCDRKPKSKVACGKCEKPFARPEHRKRHAQACHGKSLTQCRCAISEILGDDWCTSVQNRPDNMNQHHATHLSGGSVAKDSTGSRNRNANVELPILEACVRLKYLYKNDGGKEAEDRIRSFINCWSNHNPNYRKMRGEPRAHIPHHIMRKLGFDCTDDECPQGELKGLHHWVRIKNGVEEFGTDIVTVRIGPLCGPREV